MELISTLLKIHEEHEDQDHADDPNPIGKAFGSKDEYKDSADFTNDMIDVQDMLLKIKEIITAPKWKKWMQETDKNYMTDCSRKSEIFISSLEEASDEYHSLLDELDSAQ